MTSIGNDAGRTPPCPRCSTEEPARSVRPGSSSGLEASKPRLGVLAAVLLASVSLGTARGDGAAAPIDRGYSETVVVSATRLGDREVPIQDLPVAITVIDREEIRASGARTLHELLSRAAGVTVFDEIGSGVQSTFDLRGFTGGGVTVLLDGVRINDPRSNAVFLETILPEAVERIEIARGAAAATVGGGSAAGVVNIVTRTGRDEPRAVVTGSFGTFSSHRAGVEVSGGRPSSRSGRSRGPAPLSPDSPPARSRHSGGGWDWHLSASRDRTDGFRENAAARLDRAAAGVGYELGGSSRLSLTAHWADNEIGAPGALTLDEFARDPVRAPFNSEDRSDLRFRQTTAAWRGALGGSFSIAAHLSHLERDSSALTTGRAASSFGGFHLDQRVRALGGAAQATAAFESAGLEHTLSFGGESTGATSAAEACGTSPSALDRCDPSSFLNSDNRARRTDLALFAQDSVRLGRGVTVLVGGRWDATRINYEEERPDPTNDRDRRFTETSWRAGVSWNPARAAGLFAAYGESFAAPTVEDLFAFPGFGSNPELEPADASNFEVGARGSWEARRAAAGSSFLPRFEYQLSLFRTNLDSEIVFDPAPRDGSPFGQSVNAGESRRQGVEVTASGSLRSWLTGTIAFSRTSAFFLCPAGEEAASARCDRADGSGRGNDVPLVPRDRWSLSASFGLPANVSLRLDLLRVGEQVLANDEANQQRRLSAYTVLDARASWGARDMRGRAPSSPDESRSRQGRAAPWIENLVLFVEARNLLDEKYATRGIYAFDFSTFASSVFVTPAPGRRLAAGLQVGF